MVLLPGFFFFKSIIDLILEEVDERLNSKLYSGCISGHHFRTCVGEIFNKFPIDIECGDGVACRNDSIRLTTTPPTPPPPLPPPPSLRSKVTSSMKKTKQVLTRARHVVYWPKGRRSLPATLPPSLPLPLRSSCS